MRIRNSAAVTIAALLMLSAVSAATSYARVNVNVGIFAPPPVYVAPAPPPMVVVPGTYVYAVSDPGINIMFYHGYWWRPYEGRWYRSKRYNGSWMHVHDERVPRAVIGVPRDYHRHLSGGPRVPHDDMRRNWKRWERDRHWDRHEDRHDRGRGHGHRGDHGDHRGRDRY